jgi:hypothetical protein
MQQRRQHQSEVEQLDSTWAYRPDTILNNWQHYRDRIQDSEHYRQMLDAHAEKESRELQRQTALPRP